MYLTDLNQNQQIKAMLAKQINRTDLQPRCTSYIQV
jgi:hypothetical protein